MGQPNTKEMRRKARSSPQGNIGGNTTRMDSTNTIRQAAYTDILLQSTQPNSNENVNESNFSAAPRCSYNYNEQQYKDSHSRGGGGGNNSNSNNNRNDDDDGEFSPIYGSSNQRILRPTGTNVTANSNTIASDNSKSNTRQNATFAQQGNEHVDTTRMSNVNSYVAQ